MKTRFQVIAADGTSEDREIAIDQLIIGGWAGRNRAAVEEHIRELAEIGVPPPSSVPVYYRGADWLITHDGPVQMLGAEGSGEVEAVLIADGDELLVAVGSDHTDRKLEAWSIAFSKQIAAKPISATAWRLADVEAYWDELVLRAWAVTGGERVLYQEGTVAGLLHPRELFQRYGFADGNLVPGHAMFCGTLAVHGGIRPADRFECELYDPRRDRSLRLSYTIEVLPVVS